MSFADGVGALLEAGRLPLSALALATARLLGLLAILPLASRLGLTGFLRAGVAIGLALPVVPLLLPGLQVEGSTGVASVSGARLALLATKEAFLGLLLGTVMAAPFWAAQAAGDLLDQQRGSASATVPDPARAIEASLTGTLLALVVTALFLQAGGMQMLLEAVFESYAAWPALDLLPRLAPDGATAALATLDALLSAGLTLAAPLLIALLLAELALALVGRFAPQLHVFDLALSVKGLVFIIGLPLYAAFLLGYLRASLAPLAHVGDALRHLAGP